MSNANYIFFTRPSAIWSLCNNVSNGKTALQTEHTCWLLQGADRRVEVITKLASLVK